jgi:hypothetical protein
MQIRRIRRFQIHAIQLGREAQVVDANTGSLMTLQCYCGAKTGRATSIFP